MKLSALIGEPIDPDPQIAGLTADSRAVKDGFLFAALPGVKQDGAAFVPDALKNGAAAILAAPGLALRPAEAALVTDEEPRRRLAQCAARFYGRQPAILAAVTGTNGKTSTARFIADLWRALGANAGSLGTLGAEGAGPDMKRDFTAPLGHTTPDPVTLHQVLQQMAEAGVTHAAMEASSHGLAQYRADGAAIKIAAFTNITQDHLDYHADFGDYFAAKNRLFKELLPKDGVAVVNLDGAGGQRVADEARALGLKVLTTGQAGSDVKLVAIAPRGDGLDLTIEAAGGLFAVALPLIGAFQAENAALAAGVALASGYDASAVMAALSSLNGVPGRMERAGVLRGAGVYVDYAHTPAAIEAAIAAARPHAAGKVMIIVGAGGDRDQAKRPLMGAAAARADRVIITDDNPRHEDPALIRQAVLAGARQAFGAQAKGNLFEISPRDAAIEEGVQALQDGDVLLIAGKGHETGQTIGDQTTPFDDRAVARAAIAAAKTGRDAR